MKHEFDTPALRQTAEEIQGAVRAKSITADMVGGTLLALVNATGEIIETFGGIGNSITVKAKCKALINITEWEEEVAQGRLSMSICLLSVSVQLEIFRHRY